MNKVPDSRKKFVLLAASFPAVLGIFLLLVGFLAYLLNSLLGLPVTGADEVAFSALKDLATPLLTSLMELISFFGSTLFLLPANILLVLIFLWKWKDDWLALNIGMVALGSVAAMRLLKLYFSRARPELPLIEGVGGFSFPSGHSMSAMSFFGLLIYLLWLKTRDPVRRTLGSIFFLSCILLIGISRIYLRVHYLSDVLAGFFLGLIWLIFSINVFNFLQGRLVNGRRY